jgi:HK97 family phage portal protein
LRLPGIFTKVGQILWTKPEAVTKAVPQVMTAVSASSWWGSFWGPIRESFTGAWQQNVTLDNRTTMLSFSAVFACVTGIASDIAKCRIKLDREDDAGIWTEITAAHGNSTIAPYLPVLRKPNHYQTRIQFLQSWIVSLLLWGNAYILKDRTNGIVTRMYVLDPCRVTPLVAEDGSVYYQIKADYLSGMEEETVTMPANEIIHDRMVCLWHPLIGVPPIYACGISATMGNRIQANSTKFFANASRPSGILTAPGEISDETAARLKLAFETNFSGDNIGRLAILGDGLKFEGMTMPAEQSQLIEQLKFTREDVAIAFRYPVSKLGGPAPQYTLPEQTQMDYYTGCLQPLIESVELLLDEGLEFPSDYGTELDLDNLMRMDTAALFDSNNKAERWMKVDEMRRRANLPPIVGGNTVYRQQQDFSIEAIAERDATHPLTAPPNAPPPATPAEPPPAKSLDDDDLEAIYVTGLRKELIAA